MPLRLPRVAAAGFLLAASTGLLLAQEPYHDPSPEIAKILDAAPAPLVVLSPDRTRLLIVERAGLPPISEVAAPELRLAGVRLNPRTNSLSRTQVYTGLIVAPIGAGEGRRIPLPSHARIGSAFWSPDGRRIAFTLIEEGGVSLRVVDASGGESRALTGPVLNGGFGNPCQWVPPGTVLVCARIPADRAAPPAEPETPVGPVTQEASGKPAANPTFEDLLKNPRDEALFEHYFTDQLILVPLSGPERQIGARGIHSNVDVSPDGLFLLVETTRRPFSYLVPHQRFASRTEVWDLSGAIVRKVDERGVQENEPRARDAVRPGPRGIAWRPDQPSTLVWTEALDEGNPATAAKARDRIVQLPPPFTGNPMPVADLELRARGVIWARADLAIVSEGWQRSHRTRTWIVDPQHPGTAPRLLFDRSSEDRYTDPGRFLTLPGQDGAAGGGGGGGPAQTGALLTSKDGRFAFLAGSGASPEGDRPFLDRIELATGKTLRLWQSEAPYYEEAIAVLDPDQGRVLTRRESEKDPPNYFVRDLRAPLASQLTQLTRFADPAPAFAGVTSQLLTYTRVDGVQLSATLYLPAGYDKSKGPLPFFFWAYPREFLDPAAASQVVGAKYRFTRPSGASHLFLALEGYGVLDGPTMPIIGRDGKEPNDSYVEQLVMSAQAAVDKVVSMGLADPKRIGIGGHSYGAFMTANLLAHSDLFRAGIARSGAYNRTLTPFGFQNEDRTYWEAEEVYDRMSPFNYADKIKAPLLLIHGMADDNTGTFPIQSERMYAALVGHGATVRLVMLPAEAHGYRARESIGHTVYEMVSWLDRYVKGGNGQAATP
jgi:dipeptidyl aminopeptidase/acylaminoacyl peptidase